MQESDSSRKLLPSMRHANVHFNFNIVLSDACRSLEFTPPRDRHALVNHVMRNITLAREDACRVACYLDDYCLSYNFGRLQDGHFVCQLSDSDHKQHPEDLKEIDGFLYLGTKVTIPVTVRFSIKYRNINT